MDPVRFDHLAVAIGRSGDRRTLVRAMIRGSLAFLGMVGSGASQPIAAKSCIGRCRSKPSKRARRSCRKRCRPETVCTSSADCPTGFLCEDGECLPLADQCLTITDCDDCEQCDAGVCKTKCAPGEICRNRQCQPGATCSTDRDCEECERCANGRCLPDPTTGCCGASGTGQCQAGRCVPCPVDQPCVAGTCMGSSGGDGCGGACRAGQRCVQRQCVCDATSCPNGCCDGTICRVEQDAACGTAGDVCIDCASTRQSCHDGVCTCTPTSCANGCCDSQAQCRVNDIAACGTGGGSCQPCSDGHTCATGICRGVCPICDIRNADTGEPLPAATCGCICPTGTTECGGGAGYFNGTFLSTGACCTSSQECVKARANFESTVGEIVYEYCADLASPFPGDDQVKVVVGGNACVRCDGATCLRCSDHAEREIDPFCCELGASLEDCTSRCLAALDALPSR